MHRQAFFRPLRAMLMGWLCLIPVPAMSAEVAVIVNADNPTPALTARQVSDLYLGRTRALNSGGQTSPWMPLIYEQPSGCVLREAFFRGLNGMEISQVNAYWARLRFSGEVLPPPSLADSLAVLEAVKKNKNAIGYVDAALVNDSVKVVLRLNL